MKFYLLSLSLVLFSACSHHHKDAVHHHHKKNEIVGKDDHGGGKYKITHAEKTYYFDSEEERDNFLKSLEKEKEGRTEMLKNKNINK